MEIQIRQCLLLVAVTVGVLASPTAAATVQPKLTAFLDLSDYSYLKSALLLNNDWYQAFISASNVTFFAPNTAAWQKLGNDTLKCLTSQPGPGRDTLLDLLNYHTLGSYQNATSAPTTLTTVDTLLDGVTLTVIRDAATGAVTLNGVTKVTAPDAVLIPPPVGVAVHGIPDVLIPNGGQEILADLCRELVPLIASDQSLQTLFTAVSATNLAPAIVALIGSVGVTIFAPRNDAFAALGADTLTCLQTKDQGKALLNTILQSHIVLGACDEDCLLGQQSQILKSMNNQSLQVTVTTPSTATVNGVNIGQFDVYKTYQGVVHSINGVLLPPNASKLIFDACGTVLPSPPPPPPAVATPPPPPAPNSPPPAVVSRPPPPPPRTATSPPPPVASSPPPAVASSPPPPARVAPAPAPTGGAPAGFSAPATGLTAILAVFSLLAATLI